jgi:hypothetical protein
MTGLPTVAVEPGKCEGRAIVRYVRHKKIPWKLLIRVGARVCESLGEVLDLHR